MPLIVISRENLLAANDMLDREQKGELLEMIIDTVLNDGNPKSENKCVNGVYNQFISVIERKASAYFGRKKHMDEVNEQKKKGKKTEEPQVSTFSGTPLYYPPVPDGEAKDDIEKWYATLIPDGHPNRKDKFNNEWSYYFTSRTEAAKKAEAYLAKNKIHVSLM